MWYADILFPSFPSDDADYGHVTSQELMFIPGQSFESNTTSCLDLGIIDDSILEGREMFSVIMTSSATEVVITDGRAQAGVLIEEDSSDGKFMPPYINMLPIMFTCI